MFYLRYEDDKKGKDNSCMLELQWLDDPSKDLMYVDIYVAGYGATREEAMEEFVASYNKKIVRLIDELKRFETAIPVSEEIDETTGRPIIVNSREA